MIDEEYYAITTNEIGNTLIYGGRSEILYICDFPTLQIKQRIDDYTDSIIFIRFLKDDTFICATYDGIICAYMLIDGEFVEVNRIDIEEDITKIDFYREYLIVGTFKGTIHIFENDIESDVMLQEHNSEMQEFVLNENRLYTLSSNKLVCYNITTMEVEYEHILVGCVSMCVDNRNEYVMVGTEHETLVLKDEILVKRFDFGSESIIFVHGNFMAGGCGYNLNVCEREGLVNKQIQFMEENVTGISRIYNLQNSIVALSTFCGKIMVGDFENPKSFRTFDGGVGMIFYFRFYYRHILICGSDGINVIDL